jgi:hypothetical protein
MIDATGFSGIQALDKAVCKTRARLAGQGERFLLNFSSSHRHSKNIRLCLPVLKPPISLRIGRTFSFW